MRPLLRILWLMVAADRWAMARGALLSVAVVVMGAALLGLSGWFITATSIAGLAGIGIAFDVFRPSAGVRFLALGRAAARYGERLATHDATLRALAALRVVLLRRHAAQDARALDGLRSERVLTRIIADVDALDGVLLRLFLPALAGLAAHGAAFAGLGWIVGWPVALSVLLGYVPAAALILLRLGRRSVVPSETAEAHQQNLRRGFIDMIRDREALIVAGGLAGREAALRDCDAAARAAAAALDRAERDAGALLSVLIAAASALALVAGGAMLAAGRVDPAAAAIGFFVALALAETLPPLRRGFADLGRMRAAAARVAGPNGAQWTGAACAPVAGAPLLEIETPGVSLRLGPGEAAALTGPSGGGKTTLLLAIAGLGPGDGIRVMGRAPADWQEAAFRDIVTLAPQRSALIAGTVRDTLTLGAPFEDAALWAALEAVDLADALAARGGLDMRLTEGGAGLSGGQSKRLSIARALIRQPKILLLDEPTEGLDAATADRVLRRVRRALPQTAIVAALHRGAEHPLFGTRLHLGGHGFR